MIPYFPRFGFDDDGNLDDFDEEAELDWDDLGDDEADELDRGCLYPPGELEDDSNLF